MTLNEIVENSEKELPLGSGLEEIKDVIRKSCLEYAKSIIPEKMKFTDLPDGTNLGIHFYNACRTQMLSQIEEDSK